MGRENGRLFGGIKPVGTLGKTLEQYQAPEDVQRRIARRVGSLIGHGISPQAVEKRIQESMQIGGSGMPSWPLVEQSMSDAAHIVYRGRSRV